MLMRMPVVMLVALTWLAVVLAITSGPNNAMVASSGANFGYRRSVPHILVIVGRICVYAFMRGPLSVKTVPAKLAGA